MPHALIKQALEGKGTQTELNVYKEDRRNIPTMAANFSSIPILDYSLVSSPSTRPAFVRQLQHALINVGFLYLSNSPVAQQDIDAVIKYCPRIFEIPQEAKERVRMANSPHFFGYSKFGAELTKGKTDQREQYDFGTPYEGGWQFGDPEYLKLWGPSQVCFCLSNSPPNLI